MLCCMCSVLTLLLLSLNSLSRALTNRYTRRTPKAVREGDFTSMLQVWIPASSLSLQATTRNELIKSCLQNFQREGYVFDTKTNQGQIIEKSVQQNMLKRGTPSQTLYLFSGQRSDETHFQIERDTLLSSDACKHRTQTNRVLVTLTAGLVHRPNVLNVIRTCSRMSLISLTHSK